MTDDIPVSDELLDKVTDRMQQDDRVGAKSAIAEAARNAADDRYNFLAAKNYLQREYPDLVEDPAMWALLQKVDAELAVKQPAMNYVQRFHMGAQYIRNHYQDEDAGHREGMAQIFKGRRQELGEVQLEPDTGDLARIDREHDQEASETIAEMQRQRESFRERIAAHDRQRLTGESDSAE